MSSFTIKVARIINLHYRSAYFDIFCTIEVRIVFYWTDPEFADPKKKTKLSRVFIFIYCSVVNAGALISLH